MKSRVMNRLALELAVTVVSMVVWAANAQSGVTVNLNPTADAFVRSTDATRNYGGAGALSVSGPAAVNGSGLQNGLYDTLMRFSLGSAASSFDAAFGPGSWSLSSVTLRLTEVAAPANAIFNRGTGSFGISWMANDSWVEGTGSPSAPTTDGVTWNDLASLMPAGSTVPLGTFGNAGLNTQQGFGLPLSDTTFVNDLMSGGDTSFHLTQADTGVGFTFNSRTFGTASARPVLEITAVPEPGVTALMVVGGIGFMVGRRWRASHRNERG
ncbi:MAG: PEP-CTERM sorting domain-containing protein [Verrucomicrobiia bacterium]